MKIIASPTYVAISREKSELLKHIFLTQVLVVSFIDGGYKSTCRKPSTCQHFYTFSTTLTKQLNKSKFWWTKKDLEWFFLFQSYFDFNWFTKDSGFVRCCSVMRDLIYHECCFFSVVTSTEE